MRLCISHDLFYFRHLAISQEKAHHSPEPLHHLLSNHRRSSFGQIVSCSRFFRPSYKAGGSEQQVSNAAMFHLTIVFVSCSPSAMDSNLLRYSGIDMSTCVQA
eukprot:765398-Hanusia_phi.AAC.5